MSGKKEIQYVTYGAGGGRKRAILDEGDEGWRPTFTSIPVISFEHINGTLEQRNALAKEVGACCADIGFFYAKDTGIPDDLVEETFGVMRDFFKLSEEDKMQASWYKSPACRGYEGFSDSQKAMNTTSNLRESFCIGDDFLDEEQHYTGEVPKGTTAQNIWPTAYPRLREQLYAYYHTVEPFGRSLLRIFALALGLEETAFEDTYKFPIFGMRALHYPAQPEEEPNLGLGAHTDSSSFTLVCQEPGSGPALEVLNLNGKWISAPPITGATFVCNTGDFLEAITNGKFVSTVHRVSNKTGGERYSLPYFLAPDPAAFIEPLPALVDENGSKFPKQNVGWYYISRILAGRMYHPSSILLKEKNIPTEEWQYEWMQGRMPIFA